MICLGIESTAHTFGIGIVDDKGNILANIKNMYIPPTGWGIEPAKAKEHQDEHTFLEHDQIPPLILKVL